MRELQGRQAGTGGETCADLGLLESSKWSSGSLDEHVRPNVAGNQRLFSSRFPHQCSPWKGTLLPELGPFRGLLNGLCSHVVFSTDHFRIQLNGRCNWSRWS